MIESFDELNTLSSGEIDKALDEYYSVMGISKWQKEDRKAAALDIYYAVMFLFALVEESRTSGYYNRDFILAQFREEYEDAVRARMKEDDYFLLYIAFITEEILSVTEQHGGTEYYTSQERALNIGANEANTVMNYAELQEAKERGKKYKVWRTQQDERVRETHNVVDGAAVPIDSFFMVGDGMMLGPHDIVNNPKECPNCRCWLTFR